MAKEPGNLNSHFGVRISRRDFARLSAGLAGSFYSRRKVLGQSPRLNPPRYLLRRAPAELFIDLEAVGDREKTIFGCRYFVTMKDGAGALLVFRLPPPD